MIEERIRRLESQLARVIDALIRKGTDQDGDWGWPSFDDEMRGILGEMGRAKRPPAVIECDNCEGTGHVLVERGRYVQQQTCRECGGSGEVNPEEGAEE